MAIKYNNNNNNNKDENREKVEQEEEKEIERRKWCVKERLTEWISGS
jgi:hypothetical protein